MIATRLAWLTLAVLVVAGSSACGDNLTPAVSEAKVAPERAFELGARRVTVIVPAGWDALDQGKQKRFRKGEVEIVLQNLGSATPPLPDLDALINWGLAAVGHDQRRDVKSRRAVTVDGREAVDIETWNRLDHTWPLRMLFVRVDDDLLALHTTRLADDGTVRAFESIRDSLHFAVSTRR
jgi:hypothetical protein